MKDDILFIQKPITHILEDAIRAASPIGNTIESYPIYEYLMQTTFLQMTGFQEQKLKSICWVLADSDYESRFLFLEKGKKLLLQGMSQYDDKNALFGEMLKSIKQKDDKYSIDKDDLINTTLGDMKTIITHSGFYYVNNRQWQSFCNTRFSDVIKADDFANEYHSKDKDTYHLFKKGSNLEEAYDNLYRHRNRCAHNLLSKRRDVPDLNDLQKGKFVTDYFLWFAILILLDRLFITLFDKCKPQENMH